MEGKRRIEEKFNQSLFLYCNLFYPPFNYIPKKGKTLFWTVIITYIGLKHFTLG